MAQLSYVSQSRTASASTNDNAGSFSATVSAPDFFPFDDTAAVSHKDSVDGIEKTSSASARQVSVLTATGMSVTGQFTTFPIVRVGTGMADAEAVFDVTFDVATPGIYPLSGSVAPLGAIGALFPPLRTVKLDGPSVAINLEGPGAFSQNVSLSIGQYHLLVDVQSQFPASVFGGGSPVFEVGAFDVTLGTVPEPGWLMLSLFGSVGLCLRRIRCFRR
jgi:hypothetical protein